MKMAKRVISLALIFILFCGALSGCGGDGGDGEKQEPGVSPTGSMDGKVWTPTFYSMPTEIGNFNTASIAGDAIYVGTTNMINRTITSVDMMGNTSTSTSTGMSDGETVGMIYKLSTDGKTSERLPNYVPPTAPEGSEGSANINALCVDGEGNLWVAESIYAYHYELPEGFNGTEADKAQYYKDDGNLQFLRKLDPTGTELCAVDLTEIAESVDYFGVQNICCDKDDNVYITDGSTGVYAYDKEGKPLFQLNAQGWITNMVTLSDGSVATMGYGQSGYEFTPIKTASKAWGTAKALDVQYGGITNVFAGFGKYLMYYSANSNVYGLNSETGEAEKLFNFLDCNVDQDYVRDMLPLDDGSFLCVNYSWEDEAGEIAVITQRDADQVAAKTTLTLATMGLDYSLRKQILKFNKQSEQYRIEVKDYSEFVVDGDTSAALTKMSTEFISGNVPDMIAVNQLPVSQYVGRGLLEDLYPYLDADPELGREDLIPSILKVMETDGGLYQAVPAFGIMSLVGRTDVVGDKMGWTLEEMMDVYAQQPEGTKLLEDYITQEQIIYYLTCMNLSQYVDWESGKCSFDSESFINVLKFCDNFPKEFTYEEGMSEVAAIVDGTQMLSLYDASDFSMVQMFEGMFGGHITYKGFPTSEGIGNVAMFQGGVAMTSKCADKDGAWSFIRTLLTEDFQSAGNLYGFPTNQKAFDKQKEKAMEKTYETDPVTGEQVEVAQGGIGVDDFYVDIYALTQEQADGVDALIDSVSSAVNFDESILAIVKEEAGAYFNGAKSAEDVAALIQSRVSLYVNEQK